MAIPRPRLSLLTVLVVAFALSAPVLAAPGAPVSCDTFLGTAVGEAPVGPLNLCSQSFCNDDDDCQAACPSDPGAFCSFSSWTCVYPGGSGSGGPGCQSGSICSPARFCNDLSDCSSCDGGCSGYCAVDGVCRIL